MTPSNPHKPFHILTSYLFVFNIFIEEESSAVSLIGSYGDLTTGECEDVFIQTSFDLFYELLSQYELSDGLLRVIAERVANPVPANEVIEIPEGEELCFTDHIFSLTVMCEPEEVGSYIPGEDSDYWLDGFMKRGNLLPQFTSVTLPGDKQELSLYYNRLLYMQYVFFLNLKESINDETLALSHAGLNDTLFLAMAQTQYELQKHKNNQDQQ
jgi:hypothetical protein